MAADWSPIRSPTWSQTVLRQSASDSIRVNAPAPPFWTCRARGFAGLYWAFEFAGQVRDGVVPVLLIALAAPKKSSGSGPLRRDDGFPVEPRFRRDACVPSFRDGVCVEPRREPLTLVFCARQQ